jgi:dTDP-4-amino-4,6-dideoxygalactose transaminase
MLPLAFADRIHGVNCPLHEGAPMKVPLLDLKAQYAAIREEIRPVLDDVCDNQSFILGPHVKGFEEDAARYCGVRHAIGLSSGTDAILLALMALRIGPGDEVITTPFTFFATAGCVARVGATPVFVDIDPATYNIDPGRIEAAITPRTRAIIPVDLFGQLAEMNAIMALARKRGVAVIEDSAQSIGARHHGRRAGQLADLTTFSFYPSKNLGGFGDGGMIVTDDDRLAELCRILRVHGSEPKYYHKFIGGNFRLDALQAAVLRVKLRHLDDWSEARRRNARRYDEMLAGADVVRPVTLTHNESIYNQYTIRIRGARRDAVQRNLTEMGIGTEVYYPVPLHLQECFAYLGCKQGQFPESERAAAEVLSIPIYPELSEAQIQAVATAIRKSTC